MGIQEIKIIETGVALKIKIIINGMAFYSGYSFDNEKQAEATLKAYGITPPNPTPATQARPGGYEGIT